MRPCVCAAQDHYGWHCPCACHRYEIIGERARTLALQSQADRNRLDAVRELAQTVAGALDPIASAPFDQLLSDIEETVDTMLRIVRNVQADRKGRRVTHGS